MKNDVKYAIVPEDALSFLKRLPEGSVNIMSSGTDSTILHDPNYTDTVVSELQRVLAGKGAALFNGSNFDILSRRENVEVEKLSDISGRYVVFPSAKSKTE